MTPAKQGFGADHAVIAQVDDGLEQQPQLVLLQRHVQVRFQADQVCRLPCHARRIGDHLLRRAALGNGQRDIGLSEHVFRALLAGFGARHPDGRRDTQAVAA